MTNQECSVEPTPKRTVYLEVDLQRNADRMCQEWSEELDPGYRHWLYSWSIVVSDTEGCQLQAHMKAELISPPPAGGGQISGTRTMRL